jgi:DNA-binding PadR family transcriptional regulator
MARVSNVFNYLCACSHNPPAPLLLAPIIRDTIYYVERNNPALLILASLFAGTKHGYAIIQDVETRTGRRLGPGTLYGALARLEGLGFIEGRAAEERGRRPFRITAAGRRAFQARLSELRAYHMMLRGLAT